MPTAGKPTRLGFKASGFRLAVRNLLHSRRLMLLSGRLMLRADTGFRAFGFRLAESSLVHRRRVTLVFGCRLQADTGPVQ